MARIDINPDEVEDDGGGSYDPIPAGTYPAQIIGSELLPTKNGQGERLNLTFKIEDGAPFGGRLVFEDLNIRHANQVAQDIAQRDLKRLCAAVGHVGKLDDSDELHFKPLRIRVKIKHDEGFEPRNQITGYLPYSGDAPARTAAAPKQAAETKTAAPATGRRPWDK